MVDINPDRKLQRRLNVYHHRLFLVAKFAPEGIYLKGDKQRWSSAYLLPWAAAYDVAVKMKIVEDRKTKAAKRKARRAA